METSNVKVAGLTEIDRVLNTMTVQRMISFPDGIDRSFVMLGHHWLTYDIWQMQHDDPKMVATMAYENARNVGRELGRNADQFEDDLRFCFVGLLKLAAPHIEMPGKTEGSNDNTVDV